MTTSQIQSRVGVSGLSTFGRSLLLLAVSSAFALGQDTKQADDKEDVFVVTVKDPVVLAHRLGHLVGTIECPTLPTGKRCLVRSKLIHSLGETVSVKGGATDCSCTKATLSPDEWGSGEEAMLEIELKTPATHKQSEFVAGLTFDGKTTGGSVRLSLGLKCELSGLLNFKDRFQTLVVPPDTDTVAFDLPVVATVASPEFEADFDGDRIFEDIRVSDDHSKLTLVIAHDVVPDDGAFGRLSLRDKSSGKAAHIDLLIKRPDSIVVSPHTIRFAPDTNDENRMHANAILRLARGSNPEGRPIFIEATIRGKKIGVAPKSLSPTVTRVTLSCGNEKIVGEVNPDESQTRRIKWRVLVADKSFNIESPFVVKQRTTH